VWFENSGHEPFVDEPAKFTRAMVELVRPVLETVRSAQDRAEFLGQARSNPHLAVGARN
jgi:hypothetical protein